MSGQSETTDALCEEMRRLRNYARRLVGDRDRADDLVQECLLRALTRIDRYRPGSNLRAWLTTILRNLHIDDERSRARRTAALEAVGHVRGTAAAPNQEWSVALAELARDIEALAPHDQEILGMMGVAGLSTEEAANRLGVPAGTVKSRLSRARQRLPHGRTALH
ncbi:RNA polymerase sigma factor [Ferruginivarius sediminum]|jgi:RNA polymerase sigma-70 factor (ECF subfamily)|uniref:RNA polymerase sigma factor n=1 Tax=Ferruginivarius sediminum TaxID=2661937 RepID=A0A369TDS1_9PROT|nr:sigma-70 family RNA polymerase sigma factor [Ferruginivarius sediminum]RDD62674.1 hypothetical protein DRB17_05800 [Ferruginivarius sediminum]